LSDRQRNAEKMKDLNNKPVRNWWTCAPALLACAESFRILDIYFCHPHLFCIGHLTFQFIQIHSTSIIASKHFKQAQIGENEAIQTSSLILTCFQLWSILYLLLFASKYYDFCYFTDVSKLSSNRLTASGRVGIFLEKCRVGLRSWTRALGSGWEAWPDNPTRKPDSTRQDIR